MKRWRKTWDEEHKEFIAKGRDLKIDPQKRVRLFQVIYDAEPPETGLRNNSFTDFLIPEEYLSLKLFFDNLRNYAICAAFLALGSWVWNHGDQWLTPLAAIAPRWIFPVFSVAVWVMAGGLLLLNAIQSWLLTSELLSSMRAIRNAKIYLYGDGEKKSYAWLLLAATHMFIYMGMLQLIEWALTMLFGLVIIVISIGFVAYTVFGKFI